MVNCPKHGLHHEFASDPSRCPVCGDKVTRWSLMNPIKSILGGFLGLFHDEFGLTPLGAVIAIMFTPLLIITMLVLFSYEQDQKTTTVIIPPSQVEVQKPHEKTMEEFYQEFPPTWRAIYIGSKAMVANHADPSWIEYNIAYQIDLNKDQLTKEPGLTSAQIQYFFDLVHGLSADRQSELSQYLTPWIQKTHK